MSERIAHLLTPSGVRKLFFETVPAEDGTFQLAAMEQFSMAEGDVLTFGDVGLTLGDYLRFRTLGTLTDE
jgi:hypothetical protein